MLSQYSPRVEHADGGDEDDEEDQQGELGPSADEGREEDEVTGRAEDVTVDQLPPRLLTHVTLLRGRGREAGGVRGRVSEREGFRRRSFHPCSSLTTRC